MGCSEVFFAVFCMWAAMTLAMMLPVVSPWALALAAVSREKDPGDRRAAGVLMTGWGAWHLIAASAVH